MSVYYSDDIVTLHHGDCLDVLRSLPDSSVDAVVTDPPYGLEFMGREWDSFAPQNTTAQRSNAGGFGDEAGKPWSKARSGTKGVRSTFRCRTCQGWSGTFSEARAKRQKACECETPDYDYAGAPAQTVAFGKWCELWTAECLRVLKPGGMIAAFGGTRTFHRLACAIEDAGFEIRDSIGYGTEERPGLMAWAYGSGFPKSLNVTKALEALPACSCSVASLSGEPAPVVEASVPPGSVGARAGAEAGAMGAARSAADEAVGVGPQVVAPGAPRDGVSDVDALDIDGIGQALPVVLRSSPVAGAAEGQEVVGPVGNVEVNPEALRDQVMGEQSVGPAAVGALPVTLDDCGCDVHPSSPLVFPLPAPPSGVAGTGESVTVVDGHAGAGAVDASVGPAAELIATDDTDVDSVPLTLHASHSTPERMVRCEACGGVRGKIPQGLGTALKPAWEPIVVARKPLTGTVAANVLEHGTGALNIAACRVQHDEPAGRPSTGMHGKRAGIMGETVERYRETTAASTAGRWPANVVLDDSQAAELDRQSGERPGMKPGVLRRGATTGTSIGGKEAFGTGAPQEAEAGYDDTGGASRFFPTFRYEAKAPTSERPRVPKRVLRLRDDLTPEQADHVRARLTEAGVRVD